jgi:chorismate mutase
MKKEKQTKHKNSLIIAGPCGMESEEILDASIAEIKKRPVVNYMRLNLWKPRTQPGFEGLGKDGTHLLQKAVRMGIKPGIEILTADQAQHVADAVFAENPKTELFIWIGARNQNHLVQRDIAKVAAADKRIWLMAKNQPWHNKKHFGGIIEHILHAGMPKDRLYMCHRGYVPHVPYTPNPHGYRNVPDHEMAMEIKKEYGVPMIFDPSHTGGSVENVFKIAHEAAQYDYDGYIIEVHPNPEIAKSDAKQQLRWHEFDRLMEEL